MAAISTRKLTIGDIADVRAYERERPELRREHLAERVDVARQAGDDPAGALLREVAQGEAGEVAEEVAPELDVGPASVCWRLSAFIGCSLSSVALITLDSRDFPAAERYLNRVNINY